MPRLLVVDDDPALRDLLVRFLTPEGYAVETAAGGAQALAMIAASPPDLLIADVLMPGLTGWDVVSEARAQVPHLPIIFISAGGRYALEHEPVLPERVVCLAKPFDLEQVLATVTHLLAER